MPGSSQDNPSPVPIRPAATVVLLREQRSRLEVLLTRRSAQLAFMGDLWVFPGGRLDDADLAPETADRVLPEAREGCRGRLAAMSGEALQMAVSIGLHIAGCRETFEECGVLLARRPDGSPCDAAQIERLKAHRREFAATGGAFLQMLQSEDLYLDVAQLVYWSHWITPSREGKRYDTRFFAVEVPASQQASVDRTEATEHAWVTAEEAFERSSRGAMKLAPPTLATLQDLRDAYARHGSLAALLAGERQRNVPPILPKLVDVEGKMMVVLPWDPEYPQLGGEACLVADRYPEHLTRQPSRRELAPGPVKSA